MLVQTHGNFSFVSAHPQKITPKSYKKMQILGPVLVQKLGFWQFGPSRLDSHDFFASISSGYVEKSYFWTQIVTFFLFDIDPFFIFFAKKVNIKFEQFLKFLAIRTATAFLARALCARYANLCCGFIYLDPKSDDF